MQITYSIINRRNHAEETNNIRNNCAQARQTKAKTCAEGRAEEDPEKMTGLIWLHIIAFGAAMLLPEWRKTGMILFCAAVFGLWATPYYGELKNPLLTYALIDQFVVCLLLATRSKGREVQAGLMLTFAMVHWLCWFDLMFGLNTVYDRYEIIVATIQVMQVIALGTGIWREYERGNSWLGSFGQRLFSFHHSGLAALRQGKTIGETSGEKVARP